MPWWMQCFDVCMNDGSGSGSCVLGQAFVDEYSEVPEKWEGIVPFLLMYSLNISTFVCVCVCVPHWGTAGRAEK